VAISGPGLSRSMIFACKNRANFRVWLSGGARRAHTCATQSVEGAWIDGILAKRQYCRNDQRIARMASTVSGRSRPLTCSPMANRTSGCGWPAATLLNRCEVVVRTAGVTGRFDQVGHDDRRNRNRTGRRADCDAKAAYKLNRSPRYTRRTSWFATTSLGVPSISTWPSCMM
jgi:hypothetical protein